MKIERLDGFTDKEAEAARSPDMRPIPDLPNGEYADDGRNHYGAAQEGGEGVEADG